MKFIRSYDNRIMMTGLKMRAAVVCIILVGQFTDVGIVNTNIITNVFIGEIWNAVT